jgi:AcrR family transcriptional regulator
VPDLTGTKEKIFDAAVDLFSRHGYNGVSVRKIAGGAGIRESSIYNHFNSKEEILTCILDCFQEGMRSQRPDPSELAYEIEYMAPREVFRLIFIKYGKNRNPRIDKIASIIFMEQYVNQRARNFVREFMLKEPADYYEEILKIMSAKGKIRDSIDLKIAAEELNYGFLGIILDLSGTAREGGDASAVIRKLSNHVDFIFECLEVTP